MPLCHSSNLPVHTHKHTTDLVHDQREAYSGPVRFGGQLCRVVQPFLCGCLFWGGGPKVMNQDKRRAPASQMTQGTQRPFVTRLYVCTYLIAALEFRARAHTHTRLYANTYLIAGLDVLELFGPEPPPLLDGVRVGVVCEYCIGRDDVRTHLRHGRKYTCSTTCVSLLVKGPRVVSQSIRTGSVCCSVVDP